MARIEPAYTKRDVTGLRIAIEFAEDVGAHHAARGSALGILYWKLHAALDAAGWVRPRQTKLPEMPNPTDELV